ncbi:hypothetical protein JB92DRAFT_2952032 [Gautieria morchelliformis]|nr:hypothetical protein JB92DRAFT_2952032 [Gautieria morchelliformis]
MTDRGHGRGTQPGQGQASDSRNNPPPALSSYERPPAGYLNELPASLGQHPSASHSNPGPANPSLPYAPRLRPPASGPPSGNIPGGHGQSHAQGTRRNRPPEHVVEPLDRRGPSEIPHADPPLVSRNNPGPAHHSLPYAPRVGPPGPPSGNIQGGQGQPHAQGIRRNPAPEQIVDPLDRLSLGQSGPRDTTSHPVPSLSHSADDSNFEELHEFFGSADQVAKFLQIFRLAGGKARKNFFLDMFAPPRAGSDSSHGKTLLDLARDNATDTGIFLNKVSSIIGSMKSANQLLRMDLPAPITTATTNTTSESTTANRVFSHDPLHFEYLNNLSSEVRRAKKDFYTAIAKVGRFFYDEPIARFAQVEGDVVDICVVNILVPVARVMNELLTAWYDEKDFPKVGRQIISIRAQYTPDNRIKNKSYIDHVLILTEQDLHDTSDQHVLVLHEAKIVKSLDADEWDQHVEMCRKGPIRLRKEKYKMDDNIPEMSKMIPQIRKYVFGSHCPYAVLSDSCNHRGMIWGKPSGWHHKACSSVDLAEKYPRRQHTPGTVHHCQVIRGSNTTDDDAWPVRFTLAFLCYLALRDHGLCF